MPNAYLEITLTVNNNDRVAAAAVYRKYKQPFLDNVTGAKSKKLLVRAEDVQVIHGFNLLENASAYLKTDLFVNEVVAALKPYLSSDPDIRIYEVA